MSAPVIRPGILDIKPYVGGQSRIPGVKRVIKLASNEGALGPSPKAVAAYKKAASTMFRYPDGGSAELRKAIGEYHRLDPERIICGAGSDELLSLLCRAYAGPGDEVLYNFHGFAIYPILARTCGATPVTAPEKNLRADVDNLLAAVTPNTKILFIANPNNPTGSYISAQEMRRLRTELREDILLVIDAAYAEYVGRNDYSAGFDLVDGGDNVVVTRTFSKIYGLGGVRLGWCYAPHRIADVLNRIRLPFSVSVRPKPPASPPSPTPSSRQNRGPTTICGCRGLTPPCAVSASTSRPASAISCWPISRTSPAAMPAPPTPS